MGPHGSVLSTGIYLLGSARESLKIFLVMIGNYNYLTFPYSMVVYSLLICNSPLYVCFLKSTPHPGQVKSLHPQHTQYHALIFVLRSLHCVSLSFASFCLFQFNPFISQGLFQVLSLPVHFFQLHWTFPLWTPNIFDICLGSGQLVVSKDFNCVK